MTRSLDGTASSKRGSPPSSLNSKEPGCCGGSSRRNSPTSSSRRAMKASSKAIAARSSSCSATSAALPPLPNGWSLRRSWRSLRDYHAALGPIVARFEGTLDHYSGDGIMVFFNDPLPTPEPAKRAIEMVIAMREAAQQVPKTWRRHRHNLGFGAGISQGYATLGQIGFAERMDYTAIGTVTNIAARLCGEAKDGQILVSRRVAIAVEGSAELEEIGDLSLKGLSQAVVVYNVVAGGAQASAS